MHGSMSIRLIYYLLLDWQHVSTLQGHHQTFIMNQLMFRKLRTFLGFQTMFTIVKCKRSCPITTYGNNSLF